MTCSLCGKPITSDTRKKAYRQIIGWSAPGRVKVWGRKETGAFAHDTCVLRVKLGLNVEQEALFS